MGTVFWILFSVFAVIGCITVGAFIIGFFSENWYLFRRDFLEKRGFYQRMLIKRQLKEVANMHARRVEAARDSVQKLSAGGLHVSGHVDYIDTALEQGVALEEIGLTAELWDLFRNHHEGERREMVKLAPTLQIDSWALSKFESGLNEFGWSSQEFGFTRDQLCEFRATQVVRDTQKIIDTLVQAIKDESVTVARNAFHTMEGRFWPPCSYEFLSHSKLQIEALKIEGLRVILNGECADLKKWALDGMFVVFTSQFDSIRSRVSSYRGSNPLVYTEADLDALIPIAHKHRARCIIQIILNSKSELYELPMKGVNNGIFRGNGTYYDPDAFTDELQMHLNETKLTLQNFGVTEEQINTAKRRLYQRAAFYIADRRSDQLINDSILSTKFREFSAHC